jgi:hypothetical protein
MDEDNRDEEHRAARKERCVVSCVVGSHTCVVVFTDPAYGHIVALRNVTTFCAARKPVPDQIFKPAVLTLPAGSVLVPGCLVDQASGTGPKRIPLSFIEPSGCVHHCRGHVIVELHTYQRPVADNSTVTVATRTDNYRNVLSAELQINNCLLR